MLGLERAVPIGSGDGSTKYTKTRFFTTTGDDRKAQDTLLGHLTLNFTNGTNEDGNVFVFHDDLLDAVLEGKPQNLKVWQECVEKGTSSQLALKAEVDETKSYWAEHQNEKGRVYYFHEITGESTWDKPQGL